MYFLCMPSLIYLTFTIIQIGFDISQKTYNQAFLKLFIGIPITFLLNVLCDKGYESFAWMFVIIPFIFMTVVIGFLVYIFGMKISGGEIDYTCDKYPNNVSVDDDGNIIIYDPNYDVVREPGYYKYPNVIIPKPDDQTDEGSRASWENIPYGTSDPIYVS